MLSERWTKPGEPIPIKDFTIEDFKEFITFIYSGECNFTATNIFAMVDIAEFYNVQIFKEACKVFLRESKLDFTNAFQVYEIAYRYSMEDLKKNVLTYISKNFSFCICYQQFQNISNLIMKDIIQSKQNNIKQEELFEMLYNWAEKRALKKQETDKDLNFNEAIKEEIKEFLPLVKFYLMNSEFLIKFVVSKSFLFTGPKLSDLLWSSRYTVCIIDGNEKMLKGVLDCPEIDRINNIIQSKKNVATNYFWRTSQSKPSKPSKLIKKNQVEYYLVLDGEDDLCVKKRADLVSYDYKRGI